MARVVATNTYIGSDVAAFPIRKITWVFTKLSQAALWFLSSVDSWCRRRRVDANANALSDHQMKDIGLQRTGVGFFISPPVRKR